MEVSEEIAPYERRVSELSVLEGCVLWASCVLVPVKCRPRVLHELHAQVSHWHFQNEVVSQSLCEVARHGY